QRDLLVRKWPDLSAERNQGPEQNAFLVEGNGQPGAHAIVIDQGPPNRVALLIQITLRSVGDLHRAMFPPDVSVRCGSGSEIERLLHPKFDTGRRSTAHSDHAVLVVTLVQHQRAKSCFG